MHVEFRKRRYTECASGRAGLRQPVSRVLRRKMYIYTTRAHGIHPRGNMSIYKPRYMPVKRKLVRYVFDLGNRKSKFVRVIRGAI